MKAILFDLDNTLVDFMKMKKMVIEASISAMIDAGLDMKDDDIKKILFDIYEEKGIEYHYIFDDFLKKVKGDVDPKILSAGILAYRKIREAHLDPYPGVVPTLIKLKEEGFKIGIVSDAPRMKAWGRLASTGLLHFFSTVVTVDDAGVEKPSELPFKKALSDMGVKPEETIMVGNDLSRDIAGAKRLGMKTIFAKYGEGGGRNEKTDVEPDYTINSFRELLEIVL